MTDPEHQRITANEMAVEQEYAEAVSTRAKEFRRTIGQTVPNTWTANNIVDVPTSGEFIGRVALNGPNVIVDGAGDFYIGTAKHSGDDYEVFSWAAPIACTYFRKSREHHALCDDVIGVRVFAHRGDHIVDFEDEVLDGEFREDLFPTRVLRVPRAPGRPIPSSTPISVEKPTPEKVLPRSPLEVLTPAIPSHIPTSIPELPIPGPPLRAPELLRRQLAAPKAVSMSTVLSTIQSDQYEAITMAAARSQVLQGKPGTGKTIVAVHRAAYMLNAEAPEEARPGGPVLILGPTVEYDAHIRGVLRKLIDDDQKYIIKSIPRLLDELANLPVTMAPTQARTYADVSPELARHIDLALARAKMAADESVKVDPASVYDQFLGLLQDPPEEGLEPEWVAYLRDLRSYSFEELRSQRAPAFRALLAYIGVRTTRVQHPGHIIVDEAQDIHPIEWEILGRLGNTGGWTILGDLNQRRTDHTFSTWDEPARMLAIEDDKGHAPVTVLERGYRSTSQIIKFANQLLPKKERALFSLQQEGEQPSVVRAQSPSELAEMAYSAIEADLDRVGAGTVAVIMVNPQQLKAALVHHGWSAEGSNPSTWRDGDRALRVLNPESARGLEFDAVVLIEPATFPENFGRQGALYTSLTRANRFLTVVHSKPLPKGMKART